MILAMDTATSHCTVAFGDRSAGVVAPTGHAEATKVGEFVYARIDQGVVDGAVRGAGMAASGTGAGLSKMQSGKVQQYGVLLFAGTAILTGIFVAVLTA